jgi:iron complex outermembrane receptor protein
MNTKKLEYSRSAAAVLGALSWWAAAHAEPPEAPEAAADKVSIDAPLRKSAPAQIEQVIVLARAKVERMQDVPIPVTAVNGKVLDRYDAVTVQDFAKLTPNLLVQAPNARQTSVSIRGIGKNTANDALEPSVGVIVDGVPSAFITGSWGDLVDLDHVEVLRGPQGTLMGKNTTLGVVNVVTKKPTFKPEASFELSAGKYDKLGTKIVLGGPIEEGVLAYRITAFSERRDGPFDDIVPNHSNQTFQDRNRVGGRIQFLLLPTPDLSVRLSVDRQKSSEWGLYGDPPLLGEPATFANGASRTANGGLTYTSRLARPYFGGYQPVLGDWDHIQNVGSLPTISSSNGVSVDVGWTPREDLTVTSVTAWRNSLFDAHNAEWVPFDFRQYGALIKQRQLSQELRVSSSLGKTVDYTAGTYLVRSQVDTLDRTLYGADAGAFYATTANYNALKNTATGNRLLQDSLRGLFINNPAHPDTDSAALYGQLNWHLDEKATVTLGLRRTDERKSNDYRKLVRVDSPLLANIAATTFNGTGNGVGGVYAGATAAEIAAAKNIRAAQTANLGGVAGDDIRAHSYAWLINPSYKLGEETLVFTSVGQGEKSGSVQFNTTALTPRNVAPEKALDFELGVKTAQFNRALVLSANLYQTRISDYQQNLTVIDPALTAQTGSTAYRTYLGNVARVRLRGLEVDGSYAVSRQLRLNFSGAYNNAIYADFANAPCPADVAGAPGGQQQCDFTGKQLPFAPKFSANAGFSYEFPIARGYLVRLNGNAVHRGRANYNAGLSELGEQGAYNLFDAGISVQTADGKWQLSLVGKNLADTHFVTNVGAFSTTGAVSATPAERRYVGVVLQAHL